MEGIKLYKDNMFDLTWFGKNLKLNKLDTFLSTNEVIFLKQPAYRMDIPVNWLDNPYNHRSWCWILNSFQWMDNLLADYKLNHNEKMIKKCCDYFLDWSDFYIIKEQDGEFLWKDDAVSFRTFRLSIVAKYILNSKNYNEKQRSLTLKILRKHFLELFDPKKFKKNNHGIFQMRALISILTIHPDIADIIEVKKYAIAQLNWLWSKQYGEQNMHLENSTGYHQYIIKEFSQILDSPEFIDTKFIFNKQKIAEVERNSGYLFHPNGIATLFGDSNFVKQKHVITKGDHLFNEAGYAFLAGNDNSELNSYLAIRTGFSSNAHRHSDDFSFEWSEKGQIIFQDSGRYSYDYENKYRKFISSTKAHNTVTINNDNYPWWGEFKKSDFYRGAITNYHGGLDTAKLSLLKEFKKFDVEFNRTFEIERGKSLKIIDVLKSNNINDYEQWFHLAEDFDYIETLSNNRLVFKNKNMRIEVIPPNGTETIVVKGQTEPYIQGWISYSEKNIIPRWSFGFKAITKNFRFNTKVVII